MTFYLLSKSLSDIRKDVENSGSQADLDHFIEQLSVSAQLKAWMKAHRRIDLAGMDFVKQLTPDDILDVPEFLTAYNNQNGAAVHGGIPEPKYKSGEEQKNPEKYKREVEQYREALRHYIQANIDSLQALDAELREINPERQWDQLQADQRRRTEQRVMQLAQTRYLVATTVTNLSGRAAFENIPAGRYWVSNLDAPAFAGDLRLHWDVPVTVGPARTGHADVSNLNAIESSDQDAR
jgi:hypothetical protein